MGFKIKKTVNGETVWEPIKAKKYTASKTIEYTGALPITINANGQPLLDYLISGNTEQTGTPTPENPIMPEGVGERTENLLDSELEQGSFNSLGQEFPSSARIRSDYIHIQNSDNYTITLTGAKGVVVYVYDANKNFLPSESTVGWQALPFTREIEAERHVRFVFAKKSSGSLDTIVPSDVSNIMLVKGSTAPDQYIPCGYKLPILSNSTVTDIYLGEVVTTRRIKKFALTGGEYWRKRTYGDANYSYEYAPGFVVKTGLCSHYAKFSAQNIDKVDGVYLDQTATIIITDLRFTTTTDFKAFLAAQYANGTPVTVWCALTTEETGIVNEPLMKIGDYSDTVSMEQAGVSIPTIAGTTIIDYDGTPKPSQMYIKYNSWSGWSDIDNYKIVNGNWTQEMT